MTINKYLFAALCLAGLTACKKSTTPLRSALDPARFETTVNDHRTGLWTLTNSQGAEICITNYGARIVSICVPDAKGQFQDVVCGFDNIQSYIDHKQNFGALVGRYLGRILNARFTLDGTEYLLEANNAKSPHISHGGEPGFANRVWEVLHADAQSLQLRYHSPAGESGFPGNLDLKVTYTLTEVNALDIRYHAVTDAPTVLNPSNHSFFNISGDFSHDVSHQVLWVNSDEMLPYDSLKCVTGAFASVDGTPFDFRWPHAIGDSIDNDNSQLKVTKGYDHAWQLCTQGCDTLPAAILVDSLSGRTLTVYTTEPGLQIYTANGLKGNLVGKDGIAYASRTAICFETTHFQDSPNKPQFPSTTLRPGEVYRSHTIYAFGTIQ